MNFVTTTDLIALIVAIYLALAWYTFVVWWSVARSRGEKALALLAGLLWPIALICMGIVVYKE